MSKPNRSTRAHRRQRRQPPADESPYFDVDAAGDLHFTVRRADFLPGLEIEDLCFYLDEVLADPAVGERISEAIGAAIFGAVFFECRRRSEQPRKDRRLRAVARAQ